ncbi:uncharacterized protein MONOS_2098 [Monocercomonoides exilis]|uniref:uncharacterized protein n=1 Tax=Monocercomonoides exilis TaxID=2049356 RepID=UPI00355A5BF0|nr:hypothetical protein MONOS_2098 [Monocercomonoides exilis]|eukprot:MONOS_2098.1-p1 / transcript=MONOS_2098.1 / gene=MONOS_2098 / organism=Monocercomonoides_exilis_PA203 / gene_product=unspecified product / transcript_product=unspecified product / location=Mono_scaffold00041:58474-67773(+) / protein_length=3028 / sequence_SO=supercontig / SO=protein_coding / is_pseudo=false
MIKFFPFLQRHFKDSETDNKANKILKEEKGIISTREQTEECENIEENIDTGKEHAIDLREDTLPTSDDAFFEDESRDAIGNEEQVLFISRKNSSSDHSLENLSSQPSSFSPSSSSLSSSSASFQSPELQAQMMKHEFVSNFVRSVGTPSEEKKSVVVLHTSSTLHNLLRIICFECNRQRGRATRGKSNEQKESPSQSSDSEHSHSQSTFVDFYDLTELLPETAIFSTKWTRAAQLLVFISIAHVDKFAVLEPELLLVGAEIAADLLLMLASKMNSESVAGMIRGCIGKESPTADWMKNLQHDQEAYEVLSLFFSLKSGEVANKWKELFGSPSEKANNLPKNASMFTMFLKNSFLIESDTLSHIRSLTAYLVKRQLEQMLFQYITRLDDLLTLGKLPKLKQLNLQSFKSRLDFVHLLEEVACLPAFVKEANKLKIHSQIQQCKTHFPLKGKESNKNYSIDSDTASQESQESQEIFLPHMLHFEPSELNLELLSRISEYVDRAADYEQVTSLLLSLIPLKIPISLETFLSVEKPEEACNKDTNAHLFSSQLLRIHTFEQRSLYSNSSIEESKTQHSQPILKDSSSSVASASASASSSSAANESAKPSVPQKQSIISQSEYSFQSLVYHLCAVSTCCEKSNEIFQPLIDTASDYDRKVDLFSPSMLSLLLQINIALLPNLEKIGISLLSLVPSQFGSFRSDLINAASEGGNMDVISQQIRVELNAIVSFVTKSTFLFLSSLNQSRSFLEANKENLSISTFCAVILLNFSYAGIFVQYISHTPGNNANQKQEFQPAIPIQTTRLIQCIQFELFSLTPLIASLSTSLQAPYLSCLINVLSLQDVKMIHLLKSLDPRGTMHYLQTFTNSSSKSTSNRRTNISLSAATSRQHKEKQQTFVELESQAFSLPASKTLPATYNFHEKLHNYFSAQAMRSNTSPPTHPSNEHDFSSSSSSLFSFCSECHTLLSSVSSCSSCNSIFLRTVVFLLIPFLDPFFFVYRNKSHFSASAIASLRKAEMQPQLTLHPPPLPPPLHSSQTATMSNRKQNKHKNQSNTVDLEKNPVIVLGDDADTTAEIVVDELDDFSYYAPELIIDDEDDDDNEDGEEKGEEVVEEQYFNSNFIDDGDDEDSSDVVVEEDDDVIISTPSNRISPTHFPHSTEHHSSFSSQEFSSSSSVSYPQSTSSATLRNNSILLLNAVEFPYNNIPFIECSLFTLESLFVQCVACLNKISAPFLLSVNNVQNFEEHASNSNEHDKATGFLTFPRYSQLALVHVILSDSNSVNSLASLYSESSDSNPRNVFELPPKLVFAPDVFQTSHQSDSVYQMSTLHLIDTYAQLHPYFILFRMRQNEARYILNNLFIRFESKLFIPQATFSCLCSYMNCEGIALKPTRMIQDSANMLDSISSDDNSSSSSSLLSASSSSMIPSVSLPLSHLKNEPLLKDRFSHPLFSLTFSYFPLSPVSISAIQCDLILNPKRVKTWLFLSYVLNYLLMQKLRSQILSSKFASDVVLAEMQDHSYFDPKKELDDCIDEENNEIECDSGDSMGEEKGDNKVCNQIDMQRDFAFCFLKSKHQKKEYFIDEFFKSIRNSLSLEKPQKSHKTENEAALSIEDYKALSLKSLHNAFECSSNPSFRQLAYSIEGETHQMLISYTRRQMKKLHVNRTYHTCQFKEEFGQNSLKGISDMDALQRLKQKLSQIKETLQYIKKEGVKQWLFPDRVFSSCANNENAFLSEDLNSLSAPHRLLSASSPSALTSPFGIASVQSASVTSPTSPASIQISFTENGPSTDFFPVSQTPFSQSAQTASSSSAFSSTKIVSDALIAHSTLRNLKIQRRKSVMENKLYEHCLFHLFSYHQYAAYLLFQTRIQTLRIIFSSNLCKALSHSIENRCLPSKANEVSNTSHTSSGIETIDLTDSEQRPKRHDFIWCSSYCTHLPQTLLLLSQTLTKVSLDSFLVQSLLCIECALAAIKSEDEEDDSIIMVEDNGKNIVQIPSFVLHETYSSIKEALNQRIKEQDLIQKLEKVKPALINLRTSFLIPFDVKGGSSDRLNIFALKSASAFEPLLHLYTLRLKVIRKCSFNISIAFCQNTNIFAESELQSSEIGWQHFGHESQNSYFVDDIGMEDDNIKLLSPFEGIALNKGQLSEQDFRRKWKLLLEYLNTLIVVESLHHHAPTDLRPIVALSSALLSLRLPLLSLWWIYAAFAVPFNAQTIHRMRLLHSEQECSAICLGSVSGIDAIHIQESTMKLALQTATSEVNKKMEQKSSPVSIIQERNISQLSHISINPSSTNNSMEHLSLPSSKTSKLPFDSNKIKENSSDHEAFFPLDEMISMNSQFHVQEQFSRCISLCIISSTEVVSIIINKFLNLINFSSPFAFAQTKQIILPSNSLITASLEEQGKNQSNAFSYVTTNISSKQEHLCDILDFLLLFCGQQLTFAEELTPSSVVAPSNPFKQELQQFIRSHFQMSSPVNSPKITSSIQKENAQCCSTDVSSSCLLPLKMSSIQMFIQFPQRSSAHLQYLPLRILTSFSWSWMLADVPLHSSANYPTHPKYALPIPLSLLLQLSTPYFANTLSSGTGRSDPLAFLAALVKDLSIYPTFCSEDSVFKLSCTIAYLSLQASASLLVVLYFFTLNTLYDLLDKSVRLGSRSLFSFPFCRPVCGRFILSNALFALSVVLSILRKPTNQRAKAGEDKQKCSFFSETFSAKGAFAQWKDLVAHRLLIQPNKLSELRRVVKEEREILVKNDWHFHVRSWVNSYSNEKDFSIEVESKLDAMKSNATQKLNRILHPEISNELNQNDEKEEMENETKKATGNSTKHKPTVIYDDDYAQEAKEPSDSTDSTSISSNFTEKSNIISSTEPMADSSIYFLRFAWNLPLKHARLQKDMNNYEVITQTISDVYKEFLFLSAEFASVTSILDDGIASIDVFHNFLKKCLGIVYAVDKVRNGLFLELVAPTCQFPRNAVPLLASMAGLNDSSLSAYFPEQISKDIRLWEGLNGPILPNLQTSEQILEFISAKQKIESRVESRNILKRKKKEQ